MKTFKVTIARILTDYPAKTFIVQATDIVSAQIRVWRKIKTWHHVIAAEQCVQGASMSDESKSVDGTPAANARPLASPLLNGAERYQK